MNSGLNDLCFLMTRPFMLIPGLGDPVCYSDTYVQSMACSAYSLGVRMKNRPVIQVSGIDCPSELREKFDVWYNKTHIPMLLKFKGIIKATRYKRVGDNKEYPEHLSIFEFDSLESFKDYLESTELADAVAERKSSWPSGGHERRWRVQYEMIENWGKGQT